MAVTVIICDRIYGNRSKLHIVSYEIMEFKDFKALLPAKDCEHANETYKEGRPFRASLALVAAHRSSQQITWKNWLVGCAR